MHEITSKYHISPEDVHTELSNFKRTKVSGPDNLPKWVLKEFAVELSTPVADIFNASVQERAVSASWKEADVILICKKIDKVKEIENAKYRYRWGSARHCLGADSVHDND